MIDKPIAKFLGNRALQSFDFRVFELDDLAAVDIDEMIVMVIGYFLIARAAIAEIVPVKNVVFLKQADGAVDGRDTDFRINPHGPPVNHFNIGVIVGFAEHTGDNAPLPGHFQTPFDAQIFDSVRHVEASPLLSSGMATLALVNEYIVWIRAE